MKPLRHVPSLRAAPLAALFLCAGLLVAGCESGASSSAEEEELAAMSTDTTVNLRAGIPPGANQVGQDSESPTYTATEPGRLYVYDRTANALVGSFHMRAGQDLIVSGPQGRATLDGNELTVGQIKRRHTYSLYFLPMPDQARAADGDTYRIIPTVPGGARP